MHDSQQAQDQLLSKFVRDYSKTDFGKYYGLLGDETYAEFVEKIPVQTYEQLSFWLEKQIGAPEARVISPQRVVHVEQTSGSSGAFKSIPYTLPLLKSFSNMFSVWVYDLLIHGLTPETGRMFISVSPPTSKSGFKSDAEYLSQPRRFLIAPFLVSPPVASRGDDFQKQLAHKLLAEKQLEIVSIWSPTYLLATLDYLESQQRKGDSQSNTEASIDWQRVWPRLKLISCWDSATASSLAGRIREMFPHVFVQGKGLLATESAITVPLISSGGCLPLVNDVLLEFETGCGAIKRLSELEDGERYQLIVTQSAGLVRYRLGDVVQVDGFYANTPKLVFVGRANSVCDLAGEKLHEEFVRHALSELMLQCHYLLVPRKEPLGYVLLCDCAPEDATRLVDGALNRAHHYRLARMQGQLSAVDVMMVPALSKHLLLFYQSRGLKLGDIKDVALITDLDTGDSLLEFLRSKSNQSSISQLPKMADLVVTG